MKQRRRRGFLASDEGLTKLDDRMCQKGYTQESLAVEAGVSIDQVKKLLHPNWGRKIQKDAIRKIARTLDLSPTDIIEPNEWYSSRKTSNVEQKLDISFTNKHHKRPEQSRSEELASDRANHSFISSIDANASTSQTVWGKEDDPDRRNFAIGKHVETNDPVWIDLDRFVESNGGVFGKSRSEQSSLARLLLAGIIHKQAAVNLIFDLNSEYGWEAPKQGIHGKGLKCLFPNEVDIYTLDPESASRRGVYKAKPLYLNYDQIQAEDIIAVRGELNLSETNLEAALIFYQELGHSWITELLLMANDVSNRGFYPIKGGGNFSLTSIAALKRKLRRLDELKYIIRLDEREHSEYNSVHQITDSIRAGRHVVVDFGSSSSLLSYKLVTNVISRCVHSGYIRQSERFSGKKIHLIALVD